jgi:hypothetical protein
LGSSRFGVESVWGRVGMGSSRYGVKSVWGRVGLGSSRYGVKSVWGRVSLGSSQFGVESFNLWFLFSHIYTLQFLTISFTIRLTGRFSIGYFHLFCIGRLAMVAADYESEYVCLMTVRS